MERDQFPFQFTRRRFAFWLGLGLFNLSESLGADRLDDLAALAMRTTEPTPAPPTLSTTPEHWTSAENNTWRWFERENIVDDRWTLTGITRPIHKTNPARVAEGTGYLDDSLVPAAVRNGTLPNEASTGSPTVENDAGQPSSMRRARHGRPPSRWLRSLRANELRIWLKKIDVPEAGVEGMTFWEHLTRDHSFDSHRIAGLNIEEQAKLHAAAHYGY